MDYFIYLFWAFLAFTVVYDLFLVPIRSVFWAIILVTSLLIYYNKIIPRSIYLLMVAMFLFQIFGELYFGFFYTLPHYDKIDHLISGVEFCILFYYTFNRKIKNKKHLLLFSVLFSLSLHYAWELVEYAADTYFGTTTVGVVLRNPGEYFLDVNVPAKIVMPAYLDTIYDMFYGIVGAIIFIIGGLIILKKKN